jgi:hypothetical protein
MKVLGSIGIKGIGLERLVSFGFFNLLKSSAFGSDYG